MGAWQPASIEDIDRFLIRSIEVMGPEQRRLFDLARIPPQKWALPPWGDEGGGFWVVATIGHWALWYNDIEEGFNLSTFSSRGLLDEYTCDHLELFHWMNRLASFVAGGTDFPGVRLGTPQPLES